MIYNLEIDTVGANFSNPKKQTLAFTGDLGTDIKVSQLNDYMPVSYTHLTLPTSDLV